MRIPHGANGEGKKELMAPIKVEEAEDCVPRVGKGEGVQILPPGSCHELTGTDMNPATSTTNPAVRSTQPSTPENRSKFKVHVAQKVYSALAKGPGNPFIPDSARQIVEGTADSTSTVR